jgi:hypothetical protein
VTPRPAPHESWDGPAAITAALWAVAREDRHHLVASLALRLAELGHVKVVSFTLVDGDEAAEALRFALAELAALHQSMPVRSRAQDASGDTISPADGAEAVHAPLHALKSVREACVKRSRACLGCRRDFQVNPRHAEEHKFCSAACRSRSRRRAQAGSNGVEAGIGSLPRREHA